MCFGEESKKKTAHLDDSLGFTALINHVHLSTAMSLIVTDIFGHLSGLDTLIAIALTARPLVDNLLLHRAEEKESKGGVLVTATFF